MLRILVTGSRTWSDEAKVGAVLWAASVGTPWKDLTIVHGGASGVDTYADEWARARGANVEVHRPDWSVGKSAGPIRNQKMVDLGADLCLAFIHQESRGATSCARMASKASIRTLIYEEEIHESML